MSPSPASSDDDLVAAMADALTLDGGNTACTAASTAASATTAAPTSHWLTAAAAAAAGISGGAVGSGANGGNGSGVTKKMRIVGGGQGLLPPPQDTPSAAIDVVGRKKDVGKEESSQPTDIDNVPSAARLLHDTGTAESSRRSRGRSQSRRSNTADECVGRNHDLSHKGRGPRRRSGSPVEAFCAADLPTALEAMTTMETKEAHEEGNHDHNPSSPPIDEIDPARIRIGKKVVMAPASTSNTTSLQRRGSGGTGGTTGAGTGAPSVVGTSCADSGSTEASPPPVPVVHHHGEEKEDDDDDDAESNGDGAALGTVEGALKLADENGNGNGNGDRSKRSKSLTGSASTVGISNVQELAEFLAEAEEEYDAQQDEKMKVKVAKVTDSDNNDDDDDDSDDEKSLDLADVVDRSSSRPKRRDSAAGESKTSQRSYPSVTRHRYNNHSTRTHSISNNQGSSSSGNLDLGNDNNDGSHQTFSSLKPQPSSSSLLKRQASNQSSNHSSGRSVQFKEDVDASPTSTPEGKSKSKRKTKTKPKPKSKSKPAPPNRSSSFEDTAELYRQKYARCKNRSLWANLDRSIDTNVVATPRSSVEGKDRSKDQQNKATELLRRRVRMCFAAMTVVFGGGIEEDPVELDSPDEHNNARDLNDSFTSLLGDDASVRSGMTQLTARSTISAKSRRSRRYGRRPSSSSQSTVDSSKAGRKTPTKNRPSIPIGVARLLFSILVRRRGGLDLDEDFAQAAEADVASTDDSEKRAELAEARIDAIVDDVLEALTSTLGLVDSLSSYDGEEPTASGSSGDTGRRRKRRGSFGTDCAAIASRVSSLASEDTACLFINHDIHMLYGQATALYRPEVFFADTAAFNRYLYKNHTTMASWDPEVELNYEMADACLACIRRKHSSSPIGGPPSNLEYVYSLEAVPVHLLRCGRYHELGILLSKESYVRRKLRKLGSLNGVKAHIADVEDMNEVIANAGNTAMDMSSIFVASFTAMYDVLKTATDQAALKAAKSKSRRYDDRSRSFEIQNAESFYAMGKSLQEHGFEDDAVDAYNHAMDKFDKVMMSHQGVDGGGRLTRSSSSDSDLYLPPIDHIQFVMAETLVGIARVFDEGGDLDSAIEHYERALSFYSKQRSLRHRSGVASTLTTMGVINFRKKEWDVALACFDEALVILQSLEVDGNKGEEVGDIYQWQGNIKRETGDYQSALALFTEAFYTITLKYGKMHPRVGRIHQSMAIIHDDLGDFEKSLEHYKMALKIRKRAVSRSTKSDNIKAFEVATVEELAVAETLMCMGNVYRMLEDFSKAYDCYLENARIMRLDVTALVGKAFLSTHGILGLLIGGNDEGSVGAVNILYNRLMMTLDMARRLELQGKESLISGSESDASFNDSEAKFLRSEQVAECLYDVGAISASRYLQKLDTDTSIRFDQLVQQREEALSCFEEVISIRQERIDALGKLFGYDGAEDRGCADEKMIIAYSLHEVGHLLSCTFFALQQRDPSETIDSEFVSRDITAALCAFSDAKKMIEELPCPLPNNGDALEHIGDPALARVKQVPEILEELTQTMAILYRETDQHEKALAMYREQLNLHANNSADSDDARDDASYLSVESSKLSREEKVAQAIEDIGDVLRDQGDTQRALEHYTEALELRKSIDEAGLSVAKTLRLIGRLHLQRKEWDLAILRFEEERRILINVLDDKSLSIAYCFHSIGKAYEGKEDFAKALDYFKRARKTIGDASSVETDIQFTHVMFDHGNILLQMSKATNLEGKDFELALTCLKSAFDGYKTFYGETCVEAANTLFLQGELFYSHEEYETGINCFEEALRIYRITSGEEHIKVARTLNLIGLSHLESGSDEVYAMECFDACLAILQSKGFEGSEDHACVLFYKAAAHEKKEQLDLAIVCYEGSVQYYRKLLGSDAMKIAVVLEKLGTCLLNDHEPENAKDKMEEALRIRQKHRSDNDIETSEIFYGLGIAYCEEKEFNKSLDAYEKCFLLRQELLGESHVEVAQVLNNVGSVFARAGEYERALAPWNDALAMYRDAGLKEDNERIVTTISNIAISRNLISVHKEGDSIIRTFLIY